MGEKENLLMVKFLTDIELLEVVRAIKEIENKRRLEMTHPSISPIIMVLESSENSSLAASSLPGGGRHLPPSLPIQPGFQI